MYTQTLVIVKMLDAINILHGTVDPPPGTVLNSALCSRKISQNFVVESLLIVTESSSPDSKERRTQVSVSVELSDDAASSALSIFDRAVQPSSWQG